MLFGVWVNNLMDTAADFSETILTWNKQLTGRYDMPWGCPMLFWRERKIFNPWHSEQSCTMSEWFFYLLPNQTWAADWQPRLGLVEDWRITDFRLGLFVLILIRKTSSRQLWIYLTNWLTWKQKSCDLLYHAIMRPSTRRKEHLYFRCL